MVRDLETAAATRIRALTPHDFKRIWTSWKKRDADYADRLLKARCQTDRRLFARHFFKEKLEDPRTGARIPFSRAHIAFLTAPKVGCRERGPGEGWRRAWMLPRGNGKTTICIRIELVHDIVYGLERYVAVLAESAQLSRARVFEVAIELEQNKELRRVFGDLVGQEIWRRNAGEILTGNGVTILAKSMESQVRGLLHPVTNARPTKIVLDDAEDSQDVLNPELRARDLRRFTQDIEGAASVDGSTSFNFTGTPLHREALLPSLEKNPAWEFRKYPAIEQWPERLDLWERCRALYGAAGGAEEPDEVGQEATPVAAAVQVARTFYQANRKEMDRGAKVLWPEWEPLFTLQLWRWANGEAAFAKEKLLIPRDPTVATFEMESDQYPKRGALRHALGVDEFGEFLEVDTRLGGTRRVHTKNLRFVSFHDPAGADPSAPRKVKGDPDYAAIVVLGIEDLEAGGRICHVVEAWLQRASPTDQIRRHFELAERWKVGLAVIENDALKLLRTLYVEEQRKRRQAGLFAQMPLRSLERQTVNKIARVSTLEPAITDGRLTFNRALPAVFWNQFVDFPTGDHDDGPDATEGAFRFSGRKRAGLTVVDFGGD